MDTAIQETVIKAVEILTPKEGDVLIFKIGSSPAYLIDQLRDAVNSTFGDKSIRAIIIPHEIDVMVVRKGEQ